MNISKIFFFWLFLHTISRTLIWCGICSIWVPAIVLPFIFFCHTFQTLLPVIPHLWLSLDNSSDAFLPSVSFLYDIFFHSSSDKRFFLRGTAMQYHSHIDDWILRFPLDSTSLSILPVFSILYLKYLLFPFPFFERWFLVSFLENGAAAFYLPFLFFFFLVPR